MAKAAQTSVGSRRRPRQSIKKHPTRSSKLSGTQLTKAHMEGTKKMHMEMPQEVHLIDALPYFFRAYYALPGSISDPLGRQSNAVVGFTNFLIKYLADHKPSHVAVCWDHSLTTCFRNKIYPAYKANRKLPPPAMKDQIKRCRQVTEALGLICFSDERYEADDLIASLALPLTAGGHRCIVVTCDKDLCQLVGPQVVLYDFAKGERHDAKGVQRKLGVKPYQVPDYLGLIGDAVDNIPGVQGLGHKTAVAILAKFKDLESIYSSLDRIAKMNIRGAEGMVEKLRTQREMAFLSRTLATTSCDAPVKRKPLGALSWKGPKKRSLDSLLPNMGLERARPRIDSLICQ
eukprot:gnl/MRDRNA2_/MRDRNA2_33298_c0_seq1.p1 gnl/MRDRNA2_/MRDRNA2_33298_c0~~gnl/MRDRNA2_/MRDRNA2_33298_c0_seq1.p1  ORF type:complete len:345 (+),score=47.21 gnl/MRDRNA2_/MRDRNA2_33298_c0_seq1:88-1122(+)